MNRGGGGMPLKAAHLSGAQYAQSQQGGGIPMGGAGGGAGGGGGRLNTAQRAEAAALNNDVRIAHRPVTHHGLAGMSQGATGPARQVADKNYHLMQLRNKLSDIQTEITSMKREIQQSSEDTDMHARLDRDYKSEMTQVREAENELADYNLALDKLHSNASVKDIEDEFERVKSDNNRERRQIDDEFLRYKASEDQLNDTKAQISGIYAGVSAKMQKLGDGVREEYDALTGE
jgi:intraflagellar transport protein 74